MKFIEFIEKLEEENKILKIKKEVSTEYEISSLMKVFDGKPILFENVNGYDMKVVGNIFSTRKLLAESLKIDEKDLLKKIIFSMENPKKTEIKKAEGYKSIKSLDELPIL